MIQYKLHEICNRAGTLENNITLQVINQVVKPDWTNGPWIAGGALRRIVMGVDELSDFDIFFASETQKDKWIKGIKESFTVVSEQKNEFNTCLVIEFNEKKIVLQAVHIKYFENPSAVIDSFDFTICQYVSDGTILGVGEYTLWDTGRKRLVVHNISYGVASLRRIIKYAKQGFYVCSGSMANFLKIIAQKPSLIEEQFIYID